MKDPWNPLEIPLETCLKGLNHPRNTLETPLKPPCGNHETFLKHLGNSLKHLKNFQSLLWHILETFMKYPRTSLNPSGNSIETSLKLLWSLLQTLLLILLKHPRNFLDTTLKCSQHTPKTSTPKTFLPHPWNFLKTQWKLHLNSSRTSLNHP